MRRIPIVIMTSSDDEKDILAAYNLYVNCYITKPVDLDQFIGVVKSIEHFWFTDRQAPGGVVGAESGRTIPDQDGAAGPEGPCGDRGGVGGGPDVARRQRRKG